MDTRKEMSALHDRLRTPSLEIDSPYGDNTELFNEPNSFPDLELIVQGLDSPLHLHKCIMMRGSKLFQGLLNAKKLASCSSSNEVEWMFSTEKEIERVVLVKLLRFCYGETMRVKAESNECCALIAALKQLRLIRTDGVIAEIARFVVGQAEKDVNFGANTLLTAQDYQECCSDDCQLNALLAKVVLNGKQISANYDTVVTKCLMALPPHFLDEATYGKPHTKYSEINIRMQYVMCNSGRLGMEEKEEIMRPCKLTSMNLEELKQLKQLGISLGKDVIKVYESVLERVEKERDEYKRRLEESEKEKRAMARACKLKNTHKLHKKNVIVSLCC